MAIIAACLAVVAVSGHIETTEELLAQQKASDQWAFYQAKSLRRYQSEVARDILDQMPGEKAARAVETYAANKERYIKEGEEIQKKAKEFEAESALSGHRALRLHFGEVFLELAIVLCSLAILGKRPLFFYVAIAGAAGGVLMAAGSLLVTH
jgi:predicted Holliday junction resolvase-like endonuclease